MRDLSGKGRPAVGLAALVAVVGGLAAAPLEDVTVFRNVRVFDGSRIVERSTVVVEAGRITGVGPDSKVPPGALILEGPNRTLLPGLIDAHTHTFDAGQLRQAAVFGVTTELDMFGAPPFSARMRSEQANGKADDRADLLSAGVLVTAPGGHGTEYGFAIPTIERPDQAAAFVDARIAEGSDYIKIVYDDGHEIGIPWPTISRETMAAVIRAAHARGKKAVVHILARESARVALQEGADGLVHLFVDQPIDDDLVQVALKSKAFVIPTLTVLESVDGKGSGSSLVDDPHLAPFLANADATALKASYPKAQVRDEVRAIPPRAAFRLQKAGVPILAGTDVPNPGTAHGSSVHRELELLVQAGLTPAEALEAATSVPARFFGLDDRGRIAPNLRADLVLVEGDPSTDIKATRRIVGVWKRGRAIDRVAYQASLGGSKVETARPADPGLVSDFEDGKVASNFGSGWVASTDSYVGGQSKTEFIVVPGGAGSSQGSLRISGTIQDRPQPRWAGALFSPGKVPMSPTDLSSKKAITFWARGDGKPYQVMLFAQSRGFAPSTRTFEAGKEWTRHRFELKDFDGSDGKGVLGLFFGGGAEAGPFSFQIDDVRFE